MPEILNPTQEIGALVLTLPATAVGAKRMGAVDVIVSWDPASGDLSLTPPVGTDVGGGSRRVVIPRAQILGSVEYGSPTSVGTTVVFDSIVGSYAMLQFNAGGSPKWFLGRGPADHTNNFQLYDLTAGRTVINAVVGGALAFGAPVVCASSLDVRDAAAGVVVGYGYSRLFFRSNLDGTTRVQWKIGTQDSVNNAWELSYSAATIADPRAVGSWTRAITVDSSSVVLGADPGGTQFLRVGGGMGALGYTLYQGIGGALAGDVAFDAVLGLLVQSYGSLPLRLNHYGNPVVLSNGPLIIGTDPGGTDMIRLSGGIRAGGTVRVQGGLTLRGLGNYSGGAADVAASTFVVDGGALNIGDESSFGVVVVADSSNGALALVALRGGAHATAIVHAISGTWGTALDALNNFNVYWDAGAAKYRVQNRAGSGTVFYVFRMGLFPTQ